MKASVVCLVLLVWCATVSHAALTCPFAWDAVTTDVNGQPLPVGRLVGYAFHKRISLPPGPLQRVARITLSQLADPHAPRWSLPCDRGDVWAVTAFDAIGESAVSNEVEVPLMPGTPQRYRIEGVITLTPVP